MSRKLSHAQSRSLDLLRLPDELAEFLSRDTYSLIIKGGSGTGKTILALTMLKALQPLENVLYVSTRTSPLQFFEHYPWIEEIFGQPGPMRGSRNHEEGWENLVDSRLDEPSAVFERVTNVLMDREAPTVVIDSWEALGDSLGGEALRTDLRVLDSWRERAGARFIFIGEDPADSAVDHLVDGVVVLNERTMEARRVRELTMEKLRGMQVRRPSYFFTLDGGEFRTFPEYSPDDYEFRNPLPVSMDRPFRAAGGKVPTGHPSLDAALKGGFPSHATVHLEVGEGVDEKAPLIFLANLVQGWTKGGGLVRLRGPSELPSAFVGQFAKSFAKGKVFRESGRGAQAARHGKILAITSVGPGSGEEKGRAGKREGADLTVCIEPMGARGPRRDGDGVRISMSQLEGTLFLRGEVPWTPLFGAIPGAAAGNPQMQLEQVV